MYDVLIVGSGISGLFAALHAKRCGMNVAVMTKSNPFRSSSAVAAGGINAVLYDDVDDSIQRHIEDTIRGGQGIVHDKNVRAMCHEASSIIYELEDYGVYFDRCNLGRIAQRPFGGASGKRTCHVADTTGAAISQKLLLACRKEGVQILPYHFFMNITFFKGTLSGVTVLRRKDSQVIAIACKALILAGGGYAGIFRGHTTNAQENTGDVVAAALRAGMHCANLEFVQFHPTTLSRSGSLLSEAARGEGAFIVDERGERFTDELQTRDKLSRDIVQHIKAGHEVFLDLRHLDSELVEKKLPSVRKIAYQGAGVNVHKELVPIAPAAHYCIGGIMTHHEAATEIDGVYACGECAATGVHGANRLGGNSLLEAAHFGRLAGDMACRYAAKNDFLMIDYAQVSKEMRQVEQIMEGENRYNINAIRKRLGERLFANAGVYRSEESLTDALGDVHYLMEKSMGLCCINKEREMNTELMAILEFHNALIVAEAMVMSAFQRKESRGVHYREDFPQRDDKRYGGSTMVRMVSDTFMKVTFGKVVQAPSWRYLMQRLTVAG